MRCPHNVCKFSRMAERGSLIDESSTQLSKTGHFLQMLPVARALITICYSPYWPSFPCISHTKFGEDYGQPYSSLFSPRSPFSWSSGLWPLRSLHGLTRRPDIRESLFSIIYSFTMKRTGQNISGGIRYQWKPFMRCTLMEKLISKAMLWRQWNIGMTGQASGLR